MNENQAHDPIVDRLRGLGSQPVDGVLQSAHLTAIAEVTTAPTLRGALVQRARIGVAVAFGALLGASGLASAGMLGPLQPTAATVVEKTTPFEVPGGKAKTGSRGTERYFGAECVKADDGSQARNRGQYLKQERAKGPEALAVAKASRCGMPLSAGEDGAASDDDPVREPKEANSERKETKPVTGAGKATAGDAGQGKADCVENGNAGGLGHVGRPVETPATPDGAGQKPEATGKPACTEAGDAEADEAPAADGEQRGKPAKTGRPDGAGRGSGETTE